MIDVRFSTWIKAKSLEDAWEQLRVKMIEVRLGDKIREVFTPAVLEDGEIDSEEKFKKLAEQYAVDGCCYHQMKGKEKRREEKMKGWIKVRELTDEHERYIRTSDIEQIAIPDEGEGSYLFTLRGSLVHVKETPEEVFALIEEAEEKEKPWYEKAREECEKRKGSRCDGCPFEELCLPPFMWESNPVPEETE